MTRDEVRDSQPAGFLAAVARTADVEETVAAETLRRFSLSVSAPPRRAHRLTVELVHFAGTKALDEVSATAIPFQFTWRIGAGIWAITSTDMNLAGKSTVLEVIRWCLRGRSDVQGDVARWLRRVIVAFTLDEDVHAVAFRASEGSPHGLLARFPDATALTAIQEALPTGAYAAEDPSARAIVETAGATPLGEFNTPSEMEATLDAFMLDRLELQRIPTWQNRPGGTAMDLDSVEGQLAWPTYSAALGVLDPSSTAVLGEEPRTATRLLQVFLGSPWAPLAVQANVRRRDVQQQLGRLRRRIAADAEATAAVDDSLGERLQDTRARLDELETSDESTVADPSELASAVAKAAQAAATTASKLAGAGADHQEAEQRADDALAELTALRENQLARRFFHSIHPVACPRCDASIGAERQARENFGQCSVCDERLDVFDLDVEGGVTASGDGDEDALSPFELAEERAKRLRAQAAVTADALAAAQQRHLDAQAQLQAAQEAVAAVDVDVASRRRELQLQVAWLEGALEERNALAARTSVDPMMNGLELDVRILEAAEGEATRRRNVEQSEWLVEVSKEVRDLAVRFGMRNLERVDLRGNAQMPVRKGGQKHIFSAVTSGERVRLKIALVIALLRVGARSGLGRHPGTLLVDTPGTEEMTDDNLRELLREVVTVTNEVPGLQVVIAESRGPLVAEVIPADRLRAAPPRQWLW